MGTEVGSIWLNLEVTNTLTKQIQGIAKKAEAPAAAAL